MGGPVCVCICTSFCASICASVGTTTMREAETMGDEGGWYFSLVRRLFVAGCTVEASMDEARETGRMARDGDAGWDVWDVWDVSDALSSVSDGDSEGESKHDNEGICGSRGGGSRVPRNGAD
mmetsp:Transcript_18206/g.29087  ORF Transcript_18206/g.29087 Transcript_18206/m.29087 type:complete len:122 (-) Transcript_18206:41-406(-)